MPLGPEMLPPSLCISGSSLPGVDEVEDALGKGRGGLGGELGLGADQVRIAKFTSFPDALAELIQPPLQIEKHLLRRFGAVAQGASESPLRFVEFLRQLSHPLSQILHAVLSKVEDAVRPRRAT